MEKYLKMILNKDLWSTGSFSYWAAIATMVVIPINVRYLPPFMILWCVTWILENRSKMNQIFASKNPHLILLALFLGLCLWQLAGMLYSDHPVTGWQNLGRRLPLVLFPLILLTPGEMIKRKGIFLLRLFAVCTFLFVLFCFCFALYRSVDFQNGSLSFNPHQTIYWWLNYFFGTYFSVFQHPTYLAMYVLFSVFIAFESFYDSSLKKNYRIGWMIISLILLTSLYFLSSRTGLLAACLIVPVYFLYKSIKRKKILFAWIILIFAAVLILPLIFKNIRFNIYTNQISQRSLIETIKQDSRIVVWKAALNIIHNNVLLGVGTGDVNSELLEENIRVGNTELIENRLNAHNQYIEVFLENGLISLVLLLSVFSTMVYIAFSEKNLIYLMFILIILFFFLFETMLNRLAGISFFALFSFLLIHVKTSRS
jgi:O-antigen ligase